MIVADNKNIFQILISREARAIDDLPAEVARYAASFRHHHPDFSYHLLGEAELDAIIAENFGKETIGAYRGFVPFAYKADLARYCLLYLYGGIYADLSMQLLRPFALPDDKAMVCFGSGESLWSVYNGLMYFEAGRDELRLAIDMIGRNFRERYYGPTPLHITGPALLGKAMAIVDREQDIAIGRATSLSGDHNPSNYGYIDQTGRVIALRMKTLHLSDLGVAGTNQYAEMWHERRVYGEDLVFDHSNYHLRVSHGGRGPDGITYGPDFTGYLVFGPYVSLVAGSYRATFQFSPDSTRVDMTIDVVTPKLDILTSKEVASSQGDVAEIEFVLPQHEDHVQIRLLCGGGARGALLGLAIIQTATR